MEKIKMPNPEEKSVPAECSSQEQLKPKINFKSHMNKDFRFSEEFLANVLCISKLRLHKTTTLLSNNGEIMIYGDDESREYKLEDAYIILTSHKKKEHVKVLEQFKEEFFHD